MVAKTETHFTGGVVIFCRQPAEHEQFLYGDRAEIVLTVSNGREMLHAYASLDEARRFADGIGTMVRRIREERR